MKKRMLLLCVCCCAAAGVAAFPFLRRAFSSTKPDTGAQMRELFAEPRPVGLEEVRFERRDDLRRYPGKIRASREVLLSFRVSGPVRDIAVRPGDFVRKGTILMSIDPRDYENGVRALESQLGGVRATLEKAELDFGRTSRLLEEKAVSRASFDAAKHGRETANAALRATSEQLRNARNRLADTRLAAPFDGIVSERRVDTHEIVAAGQGVLSLFDPEGLEIRIDVPETEVVRGALPAGMSADVTLAAIPGRSFPARLKEWSAVPDPSTGTWSVTFSIPSPEGVRLLPGMGGDVAWKPDGNAAAAVIIPTDALVSDGKGGCAVWVYDSESQTPKRRSVRLGAFDGADRVVVLEGVSSGERIVTAGASFVIEGMKIRPVLPR